MPWGLTPADVVPIVLTVGWLVILEGLLSGDNALVLAVMVRHLPKEQQKKCAAVRHHGRIRLPGRSPWCFAGYLLRFWELEGRRRPLPALPARPALPGPERRRRPAKTRRFGNGLLGHGDRVELADIAFSIDSILAAVALVTAMPRTSGTP